MKGRVKLLSGRSFTFYPSKDQYTLYATSLTSETLHKFWRGGKRYEFVQGSSIESIEVWKSWFKKENND